MFLTRGVRLAVIQLAEKWLRHSQAQRRNRVKEKHSTSSFTFTCLSVSHTIYRIARSESESKCLSSANFSSIISRYVLYFLFPFWGVKEEGWKLLILSHSASKFIKIIIKYFGLLNMWDGIAINLGSVIFFFN